MQSKIMLRFMIFLLDPRILETRSSQLICLNEVVVRNGGLDTHVTKEGKFFSTRQRQFLCIAHALFKSSKVLYLDESIANVDSQTTSLLNDTVTTKCKGITVITIEHSIITISNMNYVLIFYQGTIMEEGNLQILLENGSSIFSRFSITQILQL
jgi:ATP-binding cassette subfamily C (CFTR/MRP) protein 10